MPTGDSHAPNEALRIAQLEADLAALRQRHAEAVEAAFREGCYALFRVVDKYLSEPQDADAAWLASEARKGVL